VAVPPAQVPEAFPDRPEESNKGVGTGGPDVTAPVAVIAFGVVEEPMPEVPGMEVVSCAEAPMPEHAVEAVIEPKAVKSLEHPSLAARLTNLVGKPVEVYRAVRHQARTAGLDFGSAAGSKPS
jgi:hypothetical protein